MKKNSCYKNLYKPGYIDIKNSACNIVVLRFKESLEEFILARDQY